MHYKLIAIVLLLGLIVGCSSSTSQNQPQIPAEPPADNQAAAQGKKVPPPPPPPESNSKTERTQAGGAMSAAGITMESVENAGQRSGAKPSKSAEPQSPTPKPGMTLEKAQVGSGERGRGIGQGIIATPVATFFKAQERVMFSFTIPDYIRAYKFEHDFKGPKSNEEFMEKIIKKNNIRLPDLPPGHVYIYDPKNEQLMVEQPQ